MKKTKIGVIGLMIVLAILLVSIVVVSADEGISVYLDGDLLKFDVPPMTKNGRTLVPMRTIFENLGASVEWDDKTQTAIATRDEITIAVKIGSSNMIRTFTYGDESESDSIVLDVPAMEINGRTLIPLRAVSEAFWCFVGWDGKYNTISIIDDNYDMYMLYAPNGRSRAFPKKNVCSQLASGWYEDESYISYGNHGSLDSNFWCWRCEQQVPMQLDMTEEEKNNAGKVAYISNREFWHDDNNEQFILTFSFLDETQTVDISSPAIVRAWIVNDNDECVYDRAFTVSTADFGYWTKTLTGYQTYRCAVYISDWMLDCGTSEKGKLYFNVYNDYFNFDTYTFDITGDLPLAHSDVELPEIPTVIKEYTYDNEVKSSYIITNIDYEINEDDLKLYFSGEKTYDSKGDKYSQSCKVGWKLYDSEGYVVDSGTFYTPNLAVGEKFRNETDIAYGCIKPGETYVLKISDVD